MHAREARTKPAVVSRMPSTGSWRCKRWKGSIFEAGMPFFWASALRSGSDTRYLFHEASSVSHILRLASSADATQRLVPSMSTATRTSRQYNSAAHYCWRHGLHEPRRLRHVPPSCDKICKACAIVNIAGPEFDTAPAKACVVTNWRHSLLLPGDPMLQQVVYGW